MEAADAELIRAFALQGSREAFAALVQRYTDLVYSAAHRQVRLQHLAEEVTRRVFTALAQNARKFAAGGSVPAWLIVATRGISLDLLASEGRRPVRDTSAAQTPERNVSAEWARIEAVLDEAMVSLDDDSRTALLLRYFENEDLRAVGRALGGNTEVAAQKSVSRALDELRALLRRRGIELATTELSANLAAYGIEIAPPALAQTIAPEALAGGAALISVPTEPARPSRWERAVLAAVIVVGVGGLGYQALVLSHEHAAVTRLRAENATLLQQVRTAEDERRSAGLPGTEAPRMPNAGTDAGRPAPASPPSAH